MAVVLGSNKPTHLHMQAKQQANNSHNNQLRLHITSVTWLATHPYTNTSNKTIITLPRLTPSSLIKAYYNTHNFIKNWLVYTISKIRATTDGNCHVNNKLSRIVYQKYCTSSPFRQPVAQQLKTNRQRKERDIHHLQHANSSQ